MKFYEALNQVDNGKMMQLPSWGKMYIQKQMDMVYQYSFADIDKKTYDEKKFYQPLYSDMMSLDWQELP